LYEQAVDVVVNEQRGSVSLLQRTLGIGYGRAARLVDFMEEDGIVGPYNGSKSREVLLGPSQWQAMQAGEDGPDTEVALKEESPKPLKKKDNVHQSSLAASTSVGVEDEEVEYEDVDDEASEDDDYEIEGHADDEEYEDYEEDEEEEIDDEPSDEDDEEWEEE
jgi:S-DNA-T family DNA segregation ATPase FtsK/SpoIIIE